MHLKEIPHITSNMRLAAARPSTLTVDEGAAALKVCPVDVTLLAEGGGRYEVHAQQQVQAVRRHLDGHAVPPVAVSLQAGLEKRLDPACHTRACQFSGSAVMV